MTIKNEDLDLIEPSIEIYGKLRLNSNRTDNEELSLWMIHTFLREAGRLPDWEIVERVKPNRSLLDEVRSELGL